MLEHKTEIPDCVPDKTPVCDGEGESHLDIQAVEFVTDQVRHLSLYLT